VGGAAADPQLTERIGAMFLGGDPVSAAIDFAASPARMRPVS
jgi:hypothetical protein